MPWASHKRKLLERHRYNECTAGTYKEPSTSLPLLDLMGFYSELCKCLYTSICVVYSPVSLCVLYSVTRDLSQEYVVMLNDSAIYIT